MAAQSDIKIHIAPDGSSARVSIPGTYDASYVTSESLSSYAAQAGVQLTQQVTTQLQSIAESYRNEPKDIDAQFAAARLARDGADGSIQWQPDFDPSGSNAVCEAEEPDDAAVDHYAGEQFLTVKEGDHVATLIQPTSGEDGVNVKGLVLKAKDGRPCPIKIESTFMVDAHGRIVAQRDGVLRLSRDSLGITNALDVSGHVDFETGNVKFDGAVCIKGGVRDRFEVNATGDVIVNGLIESATIVCKGNLTCRRGIAARDVSRIHVHQDADIGFMNNAHALIEGDLAVRREIINSDIAVGGTFSCAQGSVIGGTLRLSGSATIGELGSDGNCVTSVLLGTTPVLEQHLREERAAVVRLEKQLRKDEEKLAQLQMYGQHASPQDRERMTELSFEVAEARQFLSAAQCRIEAIRSEMARSCTVNLTILNMVHPNVRFETAEVIVRIRRQVKGPVQFGWNAAREITFSVNGGAARPIQEIAEVTLKRSASAPAGEGRRAA